MLTLALCHWHTPLQCHGLATVLKATVALDASECTASFAQLEHFPPSLFGLPADEDAWLTVPQALDAVLQAGAPRNLVLAFFLCLFQWDTRVRRIVMVRHPGHRHWRSQPPPRKRAWRFLWKPERCDEPQYERTTLHGTSPSSHPCSPPPHLNVLGACRRCVLDLQAIGQRAYSPEHTPAAYAQTLETLVTWARNRWLWGSAQFKLPARVQLKLAQQRAQWQQEEDAARVEQQNPYVDNKAYYE